MYIDHCALSAKQYDYFSEFAFNFGSQYLANEVENDRSVLLYPNVLYSLALAKFYDEFKVLEKSENDRSALVTLPESLTQDIKEYNIHEKQSSFFWLALAVTLYPKIACRLLEITELEKQNPSHSKMVNN